MVAQNRLRRKTLGWLAFPRSKLDEMQVANGNVEPSLRFLAKL